MFINAEYQKFVQRKAHTVYNFEKPVVMKVCIFSLLEKAGFYSVITEHYITVPDSLTFKHDFSKTLVLKHCLSEYMYLTIMFGIVLPSGAQLMHLYSFPL